MTEKDRVCSVETIQITSPEILAGAFKKIGFEANLAKNIYDYVCGVGSEGCFKMSLQQFTESERGCPGLIISFETNNEGEDCRVLAKMLIDENRTILKDKKKEKVFGRLFEVTVDKQEKLALSDEEKKGVLLNLRSVLE